MYEAYNKWPQLARSVYESELNAVSFENIDHIILVGMGGSGAVCGVISAILSKTPIHTSVVKGYHLPNTADANTLVILVSVSGDTIETHICFGISTGKILPCRIFFIWWKDTTNL